MSRVPQTKTAVFSAPARPLLIFVVVLVALRSLFLLATLEPAEERVMEVLDPAGLSWDEGPSRPLYDREELYTATAAEAIRRNFGLSPTTYQFMAYGGGSLVTSLLAIPVQSVFGPNYLAFKLIPLLVTVLGAVFWTILAASIWGSRAAWVFASLYLLAPSVFVRTMWIAKGDHAEAATWIGAVFLLALGAARTPRRLLGDAQSPEPFSPAHGSFRSTVREPAFLCALGCGLAAGWGVFLTYSTIPVVAGAMGAALLISRFQPLRIWTIGAIGFAIGLVPWAMNLLRTRGAALSVYSRPLGVGDGVTEAWSRLQSLFGHGFLATYDLPEPALRQAAALAFTTTVVVAWWALGARSRARAGTGDPAPGGRFAVSAGWILLAATAAHLLAYCLTAPDRSSRYLIPVYPLLLLAIAGAVAHPPHPRFRQVAVLLTAVVLLIGLGAQAHAIGSGRFRSLVAPLRSTDWPLLGEVVGQKLGPAEILGTPPDVQTHLWTGLGIRVFHSIPRQQWADALGPLPAAAQIRVWEGIGVGWGQSPLVFQATTALDSIPRPARRALVRGIARYAESALGPALARQADGSQLIRAMANGEADLVEPVWSRLGATLDLHGFSATARTFSGLTKAQVDRGIGAASYGGISAREPTLWFWSKTEDDPRNGSQATWEGVVESFERDLRLVTPDWILARGGAPTALAALLDRCVRGCSAAQSAALYRAAGRVARDAWIDSDLSQELRAQRSSWPWSAAIPAAMQAAFAQGLEEARTP